MELGVRWHQRSKHNTGDGAESSRRRRLILLPALMQPYHAAFRSLNSMKALHTSAHCKPQWLHLRTLTKQWVCSVRAFKGQSPMANVMSHPDLRDSAKGCGSENSRRKAEGGSCQTRCGQREGAKEAGRAGIV